MSTPVTVQEFRDRAEKDISCCGDTMCGDCENELKRLLLAAAEQGEQLARTQTEAHLEIRGLREQIAALTAENEALKRRAESAEADWKQAEEERDIDRKVFLDSGNETATLTAELARIREDR